jgi:tRNA pseudouridine synthase 9
MSLGRMNSSIAVTYTIEIVNGIVQRKVSPYIQEFETFAKGRWIGRNLLEVLKKEFGAHPPVYWQNSIRSGSVKVNGSNVDESYVLKNGDKFLHRTHRYDSNLKLFLI